MNGSSPLTRGALREHVSKTPLPRLIPAHAGSTSLLALLLASSPAHPRSRGEHFCGGGAAVGSSGSSPLPRGAHPRRSAWSLRNRLIPAHAGSTKVSTTSPYRPSAHPRSRGEHKQGKVIGTTGYGSSPLTRGAHSGEVAPDDHARLIPAHAGSTSPERRTPPVTSAHPRSRGEHPQPPASTATKTALKISTPKIEARRLIPARTGNTRKPTPPIPCVPAHPRSRGEHRESISMRFDSCGSSPLTRGTPHLSCLRCGDDRLIPARAGNTVVTAKR